MVPVDVALVLFLVGAACFALGRLDASRELRALRSQVRDLERRQRGACPTVRVLPSGDSRRPA